MPKSLRWKIAVLLASVLFGGIILIPTLMPSTPQWWQKLTRTSLRLGLDLQGGMHLVLKVNLDKALENSLDLAASDLKERLAEKKINLVRADSGNVHRLLFILPNTQTLEEVKQVLADEFSGIASDIQVEAGSFPRLFLSLSDDEQQFIRANAVKQSLEIIRNRIDQFGVSEPVILRQGDDEIVVQLPGVKDPKRALSLIGQTAQLQFKLVEEDARADVNELIRQAEAGGGWKQGDSRKKLNLALKNVLPAGSEIYFEKRVDKTTGKERRTPILLKQQVMMTGEMVKDARVRVGGTFNEPYVSLDLTGRGGRIFAQVTSANVGKRFAIILDETVRSAPVIREKILGGRAQISGDFTYEEANDLAIVLRVGALPAPVEIVQNLTVGASLGHDSIQRGLNAGLIGLVLVVAFMVFYYRFAGVIANFGLVFNIFFLFAGLAAFSATLTLPGIAGIILTIGMAVDANVLIFERMREEFALGKPVGAAIDDGYGKAHWTIVDSQVTTLITAVALFLFGTGPIKGFAVTLSLGVLFNLFTTLFCTRIVFDWLYSAKKLAHLKFVQYLRIPAFDFMALKKISLAASAVMVAIGCVAFGAILIGKGNLGVDFSGGSLLQYQAVKPYALADVRTTLETAGVTCTTLQDVTNEHRLIVRMKKSEKTVGDLTDRISSALTDRFGDGAFVLESRSEIGASVSEALRDKAVVAIVISLFGVVAYLAFRFNFSFGVTATVTTFHDVIVVLGICWLLNIEITLLIVTALLTLAGYSLNDTVVIFDRIRENGKKTPNALLTTVINRSINEVLSRTLVTSMTTAVALLSLLLFGGVVLRDFSLALFIGILVGTYSSIFIACPLLTRWQKD